MGETCEAISQALLLLLCKFLFPLSDVVFSYLPFGFILFLNCFRYYCSLFMSLPSSLISLI